MLGQTGGLFASEPEDQMIDALRPLMIGLVGAACLGMIGCGGAPDDVDTNSEEVGSVGEELGCNGGGGDTELWDDFQNGFTEVSTHGASAKWFYFGAPPFVGDDGIVQTGPNGLRVVSPGTNPSTGKPAFTKTVSHDDEAAGVSGVLDHVKWLAYANHAASSGYPGWDGESGREVACNSLIGGRTYGTAGHPFGNAVKDHNNDMRLASFAMNVIDFDTFLVFDFFFTNEKIYAIYERLPFARGVYGNYAAFTYLVPLASYDPLDTRRVKLGYDKDNGIVRWYVDGVEKFRVDKLGYRLKSRKYLTLDHGGTEALVSPNQISCGMGMFSLLDGELPSHHALVRISATPNLYFDPTFGEPTPQTFFDEDSLASNRLFGQGAEFRMKKLWVTSSPVHDHHHH